MKITVIDERMPWLNLYFYS